ncbi:MAG TPA: GxxExxY protein [Chitinophagaceae bacterium]|nr:GxxExxY protein [Chitinophagaceae bacterium]
MALIKQINTDFLYTEITDKIIHSFYTVYNTLGYGFLEKVYENAMMLELIEKGMLAQKQNPIKVHYREKLIGEYFADIIVEEKVIIELKAAEAIVQEHELQLINYLKATEIEIGLLLNFGKKPEIKRKIFTNDRKINLR